MVLKLERVEKSFGDPGTGQSLTVLDMIDLEVEAGESVAIVGPSGSGKSTLLHIMGGLDLPSSGAVFVNQRNIVGLGDRELAGLRNREIGFVFQLHHLLPQCTVLENCLLPTLASASESNSEELLNRALRLLERVGLEDRANHRPAQLSGGEGQRAAVVRALINGPGLLLADEPTGSLDAGSAANLADLLAELNREEKITMVVVTHSTEIARRMDRVLRLEDGRLHSETEAGSTA